MNQADNRFRRVLPCKGNDPTCPCQDGDKCHYKGPNAWPVPVGQQRVSPTDWANLRPDGTRFRDQPATPKRMGRPPVIKPCPRCGAQLTAREMQCHKCEAPAASAPKAEGE